MRNGTFTYTPATIASTPKDQVRYLIGDTDPNEWLLSDEEITFTISIERGVYYSAARACQSISAYYARQVQSHVGTLSIGAHEKFLHYQALTADLMKQASIGSIAPIMPSQSISDKQSAENDPDRVPPFFGRDQYQNPRANGRSDPRTRKDYVVWP